MPPVTRALVRCALFWLVLALSVQTGSFLPPSAQPHWLRHLTWFPVWLHLVTVGWLTQLIFAIGWWMLPVIDRARGRGSEAAMAVVGVLLNAGVLLRAVFEPLAQRGGGVAARTGFMVAVVCLGLTALLYAALIWRRIR